MAWIFLHSGFMSAAFLMILVGIGAARFLRSRRWWLTLHRAAGICAAVLLISGAVAAVVMVDQLEMTHFRHPHTWLGAATVLIGASAPTVGYLQFKIRARTRQLRLLHRRLGYALLVIMPATLLSGLLVAGIL